jgi:hypothetical protein
VPRINLLDKFDGTCSNFQSFINQICLIIQLHQHYYLNDWTQVGLTGTLLLGTTLEWFALLLECQSPPLNDFETFFEKFGASFNDLDKERLTTTKLQTI